MPNRLALLGAREGPWVQAKKFLRVAGLAPDAEIHVVTSDTEPPAVVLTTNGDHELPALAWVRVNCTKPTKKTICMFVSRAA